MNEELKKKIERIAIRSKINNELQYLDQLDENDLKKIEEHIELGKVEPILFHIIYEIKKHNKYAEKAIELYFQQELSNETIFDYKKAVFLSKRISKNKENFDIDNLIIEKIK